MLHPVCNPSGLPSHPQGGTETELCSSLSPGKQTVPRDCSVNSCSRLIGQNWVPWPPLASSKMMGINSPARLAPRRKERRPEIEEASVVQRIPVLAASQSTGCTDLFLLQKSQFICTHRQHRDVAADHVARSSDLPSSSPVNRQIRLDSATTSFLQKECYQVVGTDELNHI